MTIISMTTGIVIDPSVSRRTTRTCGNKTNVYHMFHSPNGVTEVILCRLTPFSFAELRDDKFYLSEGAPCSFPCRRPCCGSGCEDWVHGTTLVSRRSASRVGHCTAQSNRDSSMGIFPTIKYTPHFNSATLLHLAFLTPQAYLDLMTPSSSTDLFKTPPAPTHTSIGKRVVGLWPKGFLVLLRFAHT